MKKPLKLPAFKNEDEERDFWASIEVDDYFEPEDFVPVSFPNLKPSTRPVSIRMPITLIQQIKERANEMGVPYQTWVKMKLFELVDKPASSKVARQ